MKISKLIELLHPYQDCDAIVDYYDPASGERRQDAVKGVILELNEDGEAVSVVIKI